MEVEEISPFRKAVLEAAMKIANGRKMIEEGTAELDHLLGEARIKPRAEVVTNKVKELTAQNPSDSKKQYPEREEELQKMIKESTGWATAQSLRKRFKGDYWVLRAVLRQLEKKGRIKCVYKKNNPHHPKNVKNRFFAYWVLV